MAASAHGCICTWVHECMCAQLQQMHRFTGAQAHLVTCMCALAHGCVAASGAPVPACWLHRCALDSGLCLHVCTAHDARWRGAHLCPLSPRWQHSSSEFASVAALLAHYSGAPGGCFCRLTPGRCNPGYEEQDPGGASAWGEAAWAPAVVQHERG